MTIINYIKAHKYLLLIIIPAFVIYLLVIFPSGTFFCFKEACGINFWGVHGHDAIWHLAIANTSFNKFPFVAPTFAGENLYGYNYLLDFFIFLLSKAGIPAIFTYFKLLPVIWFILFTSLLILLAKKIKDSALFVFIFLFLNYLAGSFSYLLTLMNDKTLNGSSTLLPQPIMHMMSNLPYAFSLLPFLLILILLKEGKLNTKKILLIGFSLFLIMGLKFYGGIIAIFMVFLFVILAKAGYSPFREIQKKTGSPIRSGMTTGIIHLVIICIFIVVSILFFYDPFRSVKTGFIFGWAPFALVHTITEDPGNFYLRNLTDARYYILAQGRIGPRFIWIELVNLTLFLFFYLGTRFFALIYIAFKLIMSFPRKRESRNKTGSSLRGTVAQSASGMTNTQNNFGNFDYSVILTILFSILLTVTLVQKAEWWNTIQFFFYTIFLLTIYLSLLVFDLIKSKKSVLIALAVVILLISIPTSLDLIRLFAVTPGAAYIPVDEVKALDFLKKQADGTVLTPLYNPKWKNSQKPNPLYAYEDTAYVAAFSGKQEYFANILQLRLTGVSYKQRLERLKKMDCTVLKEVNYVYEIRKLIEGEKIMEKCKPRNFKKILENKSINIYSKIK